MSIPERKDWTNWEGDLDGQCAFDNFFGKSLAEAEKMFEHSAITYQEDLYYMSKSPFIFYLRAYINYLNGPSSEGDSDAASCFIGVIRSQITHDHEWFDGIWTDVKAVLDRIAVKQSWYDAPADIYGSFERRSKKLLKYARTKNLG